MIMTRTHSERLGLAARAALWITAATLLLVSPTLSARTGDDQLFAGKPITLSLEDAKLRDVLSTFARVADATIAISPQAAGSGALDSLVTVDVDAQPWDRAFDDLLSSWNLAWTREGKVIWVYGTWESLDGDREFTGQPITLQLDGADLHDVLKMMTTLTGFDIAADPELDVAVTIDATDMPWDQVLDMILRVNGLTSTVNGEVIRVQALGQGAGVLMAPPREANDGQEVDGEKVYRFELNGPISPPTRLESPPPEYPEEAREEKVQGVVVLEVVIDSAGHVADTQVIRDAPAGLTEAAVEAVRQWQFEPARLDGRPVAVQYVLTIKFSLDDPPSPDPGETIEP